MTKYDLLHLSQGFGNDYIFFLLYTVLCPSGDKLNIISMISHYMVRKRLNTDMFFLWNFVGIYSRRVKMHISFIIYFHDIFSVIDVIERKEIVTRDFKATNSVQ